MNMSDYKNCMLIDKESYEKYKKLKKFKLEASERFGYVRMLTLRLFILIDLLDNDLYDYDELLTDIKITVENLYNYSRDYRDLLNDYLKNSS